MDINVNVGFLIIINYFLKYHLNHYPRTYISMKIDPKGKMPPNITMTKGSINHFFSGMGRGTAFTRHG